MPCYQQHIKVCSLLSVCYMGHPEKCSSEPSLLDGVRQVRRQAEPPTLAKSQGCVSRRSRLAASGLPSPPWRQGRAEPFFRMSGSLGPSHSMVGPGRQNQPSSEPLRERRPTGQPRGEKERPGPLYGRSLDSSREAHSRNPTSLGRGGDGALAVWLLPLQTAPVIGGKFTTISPACFCL